MKQIFAISVSLMIAVVVGCVDPYSPHLNSTDAHYLVVEGNLNTNGPTQIRLSWTTPLAEDSVSISETGATVQIESDNGTIFALAADSYGTYSLPQMSFDTTRLFRIKITTADNKSYASDFVPAKSSPTLDSVNYTVDGSDVQVYVSGHDARNNTHYYLWKYVETWEYSSRYPSEYIFSNGVMTPRGDRFEIYYCWKTASSNQIFVASSAKLAEDIIHEFPIRKLQLADEQFQIKYSVLVEQYALTSDAFAYWQQLKKSTESLGTIFDPQPSQIQSNIHNISDPGVPAVGYFSAGSTRQTRIFIAREQLPQIHRPSFYDECVIKILPVSEVPLFDGYYLIYTADYDRGGNLTGYETALPQCVDCRIHGGINVMPGFWQ